MSIETLRRAIRGTVIAAGEAGYDEACGALLFNQRNPARRPAIVVRAACVEDVQATVRYAARQRAEGQPAGQRPQLLGDRVAGRDRARPRGDGPDRDRRRGEGRRGGAGGEERRAGGGVDGARARVSGRALPHGGDERLPARRRLRLELGGLGARLPQRRGGRGGDGRRPADPGERCRASGRVLGGARRGAGVLRRRGPLPAAAARAAEGDPHQPLLLPDRAGRARSRPG